MRAATGFTSLYERLNVSLSHKERNNRREGDAAAGDHVHMVRVQLARGGKNRLHGVKSIPARRHSSRAKVQSTPESEAGAVG